MLLPNNTPIVAIDPGKKTGVCIVAPVLGQIIVKYHTIALDSLPVQIQRVLCEAVDLAAGGLPQVVMETFALRPHQAKQQSGSKMPAAEAIGIVRGVMSAGCLGGDAQIRMLPPGSKAAGALYAKTRAVSLYDHRRRAKGDHQRDAFDLAAYVIREHYITERTITR